MAAKDIEVPAGAVVEVISDPTPELFAGRRAGLTALLRMALLAGVDMSVPTILHLAVDISDQMLAADRQLLLFDGRREEGPRLQVARHFEGLAPPELGDNLLNQWCARAGKPVLCWRGATAAGDEFLRAAEARHALAAPLFLEFGAAGSLQLFRRADPAFVALDAQLLWLLTQLAENQLARAGAARRLLRMAFTDFLTGLRTRGYFEQELNQEVKRALRRRGHCAVVLLDIDDFKHINDRWGHHAGDEVLRQFARAAGRGLREVDTLARYGGDEFAMILPETDREGARFVANRAREAVRAAHFWSPEFAEPLRLTISLGVAVAPEDGDEAGRLLRAADLALYRAKREGKDRLLFSA